MQTVPAKTIVTHNKSAEWFGCAYNMNLYRGCCHGCIYCDSRSDCYHVDDFGTVRAKADALRIVRDDLRRKVRTGVVCTGSMSDPYNPFEAEECLTRHALELLDAYGFGVCAITKSPLVTRDADILASIAERSPALAVFTVTTADDALAAKIEPGAPPPSQRLAAMGQLARRGVFTGVLLMPVLPFLEDSDENVVNVLRTAKENGARFVHPMFGLTMRDGQREYFYAQLDRLFPELRERYERQYGTYYVCRSPRARALGRVFLAECARLGLLSRMEDIVAASQLGYGNTQLSLNI